MKFISFSNFFFFHFELKENNYATIRPARREGCVNISVDTRLKTKYLYLYYFLSIPFCRTQT